MFAEPSIDDFLALIDWHIKKALYQVGRAVGAAKSNAAKRGAITSSVAIQQTILGMRKEFEAGVDAVFGELKRVIRTTKLDHNELRKLAFQRLSRFAEEAKRATEYSNTSRLPMMHDYVRKQFEEMDQFLNFKARQFDIGFFDPAEPEVPTTANNLITIGTMTNSTIQQGSPGATQKVDFKIEIHRVESALQELEAAIKDTQIPKAKIDEVMADVRTIQAQLKKSDPSKPILQEAGASLSNVLEGVAAGLLTPGVSAAVVTLSSALGLS
jgi:hypothetical protein